VKLSVVALDYDGTVALDGRLEPKVRDAIAALRTRGVIVLLVTGRILDELRRVAGEPHFVDGVIAENGSVIYFADSEYESTFAPPIPAAFVAELARRGIRAQAGRCLVDASSSDAGRLLDVISTLELPLVLAFNRGRVMGLAARRQQGHRTACGAGYRRPVGAQHGPPSPPDPNERGWKETVRMNPGECTTVIMKFDLAPAPFAVPASRRTGGHEYVWHCHILEHEEHDMMQPLIVA
jgi:hypothetical protein